VITFEPVAIGYPAPVIASQYRLLGTYPNPFNASTTLEIESPRNSTKQILFYDIQGRLVKQQTVSLSPGLNNIQFDSQGLSTGIYFAQIENESVHPVKLMLLK